MHLNQKHQHTKLEPRKGDGPVHGHDANYDGQSQKPGCCWACALAEKGCCPNIHKGFGRSRPRESFQQRSCTTLALPCLPAPAESQEERKEENTEAVLEKNPGQKTLEQLEAEAFEQLEVRAAAAKDAKDSKKRKDSLKRPAASKVPKKGASAVKDNGNSQQDKGAKQESWS